MEPCRLVKPDESYLEEIRAYREEVAMTDGDMDGMGSLRRISDVSEWLRFTRALENPETVPENMVPSDQYLYVREADNRIVGMINVRRELNETLAVYGGHVGYSVRPSERRKGYGKRMLSDCLAQCRACGLVKVLLSCRVNNEGSRRTILANGGELENIVYIQAELATFQRYWIKL
ncbi:MAG: GNAT family N-acetyltransferase [Eubacteriales bacterium]|nr:GNAT family N-acetyltransferase [Eubacteriales bacterium]